MPPPSARCSPDGARRSSRSRSHRCRARRAAHAACTVPDHGNLRPWRFVVVSGDAARCVRRRPRRRRPRAPARSRADVVGPDPVQGLRRAGPDRRGRPGHARRRSPSGSRSPRPPAPGYAIALAAHQLGLGAIWKSRSHTDGATLRSVLDLGPDDRFLGWVNLGRTDAGREAAVRPALDLAVLARRLDADGHPAPVRTPLDLRGPGGGSHHGRREGGHRSDPVHGERAARPVPRRRRVAGRGAPGPCSTASNALDPRSTRSASSPHDEAHGAARPARRGGSGAQPHGPLDGVPTSIKDLMLTKGWPTRRGSRTVDPDQPGTSTHRPRPVSGRPAPCSSARRRPRSSAARARPTPRSPGSPATRGTRRRRPVGRRAGRPRRWRPAWDR